MKKNIRLNKQIIKALSIGISASMMLQPMAAFANPENDEQKDNNTLNVGEQKQGEAEVTTAAVADQAADVETKDITPAIDKVEAAVEAADTLNEALDEINAPAKQHVSSDALETELGMDDQKVSDAEDDIKKVESDIQAIADEDLVIASEVGTVNQAITDANTAITTATGIQTEIETEINTAAGLVEEADKAVDGLRTDIEAASTLDEATALRTTEAEVEAQVQAADKAVEDAREHYNQAEEDFAEAEQAYETAEKTYNDTVALLEQAEKDYADLKATADTDSAEAAAELQRLADEAEKLAGAAADAKKNYEKSGYAYIAALEKKYVGTNVDFNKTKDLFTAIVKHYYVPDMLEGQFVSLKKIDSKGENFYYTDEDGDKSEKTTQGDSLKYYLLTYKDAAGNTYTKELNYKTNKENDTKNFEGLVIFEKTEHAVYDGQDLSEEEVAKLEKGEVVDHNGTLLVKKTDAEGKTSVYYDTKLNEYYVGFDKEAGVDTQGLTDVTASNTVDATTGLGTQVVIDKEETTWNYDSTTDTLTKTVTKDYTTTTYTGASLSQEATLTQDASRQQYLDELQALIDDLQDGQELTIAGETFKKGGEATATGYTEIAVDHEQIDTVGYTVNGTYQDKYSKNFTYKETGYIWWDDEGRDRDLAYDYAYGNLNENYTKEKTDSFLGFGGHYEGEKEIAGTEKHTGSEKTGNFWEGLGYEISGTVEYQKVQSVSVDRYFAIFGLFFGNKSAEQRKNEAIADIVAKGGTFVEFIALDGNIGSGSILYIPGHAASEDIALTTEITDEEAAKAAFEEKYEDAGKYNVKVTGATAITEDNSYKTYGYSAISYIIKTVEETKGAKVAETVWNTIVGTSDVQYRNDNWYTGDVLLVERNKAEGTTDYTTDNVETHQVESFEIADKENNKVKTNSDDFRAKVDAAAEIAQKYADLIDKAGKAQEAVAAAKSEVLTLKDNIAKLNPATDVEKLAEFKASLETAKTNLEAAEKAKKDLDDKLTEVKTELETKITALTPGPAPSSDVEPTTGETTGENTTDVTPGTQTAGPASTTPAPAEGEQPEEENNETTGEEETPATEENTVVDTADIYEEGPALADTIKEDGKTIEDEDTALAAMPEAQQMSWWWLLLILVLGTTGAEMYRRHMVKKNAAKVENTENK